MKERTQISYKGRSPFFVINNFQDVVEKINHSKNGFIELTDSEDDKKFAIKVDYILAIYNISEYND